MKCAFCGKYNTDDISITDSETERELLICAECDEMLYFDVPEKLKKDGYEEMTIQELEDELDEVIEYQMENSKLKEQGVEI